jgi:hypothetical protein
MKKLGLGVILAISFLAINGCTNDEGNHDIDIITPVDTTQGLNKIKDIPSADL